MDPAPELQRHFVVGHSPIHMYTCVHRQAHRDIEKEQDSTSPRKKEKEPKGK
jgi:hypothetical protein